MLSWTHGHHQMVNSEIRLIIFSAAKDGEALYSQQKQPGADCGSDHEFLITKFRLKLNNVGKTTRPFRYDLNQIPYDYTVEVRRQGRSPQMAQIYVVYKKPALNIMDGERYIMLTLIKIRQG